MCIIVDANRMSKFLSKPKNEDVEPIYKWVNGPGRLVYSTGGKFRELGRPTRQKLARLAQTGQAKHIPASSFEKEERQFENNNEVRSDDYHILALAKVSGTRILYTNDSKLQSDFKDRRIINPKGRIYTRGSNADLLHKYPCPE